ncbi:MAG: NAD(P)-binding protein [Desulfobacterales bacterium]|jgi:glycine/D-amino acid oxidase-like deaminating enzyme
MRIVIIGTGISGLTSAYLLSDAWVSLIEKGLETQK